MAKIEIPVEDLLSEEQWTLLRRVVYPLPGAIYQSKKDLRRIVEAIRHMQRHNCAWEDLPRTFPPAAKVKQHYAAWRGDGTLQRISSTLTAHRDGTSVSDIGKPHQATKGEGRIVIVSQDFGPQGIRIIYRVAGQDMPCTIDFNELNSALRSNDPIQQKLIGILAIAASVRYFRADDVNRVVCETIGLGDIAIEFLQRTLTMGLAEFRYRNRLNYRQEIAIETNGPRIEFTHGSAPPSKPHALLMNGGGKDSVVAAEILKAIGLPFKWFIDNAVRRHNKETMAASGNTEFINVKSRRPVPDGAVRYKGHAPFNSYVAVLGVLTAYLAGYRYVVVANELSANAATVVVDGFEINHQYTKSLDFESGFIRFLGAEFGLDIHYFSALRPLYEIEIARVLAEHKQYLGKFISCNAGQLKGYWCGKCAKCAFVFLSLAPFVTESDLQLAFGDNFVFSAAIREHFWRLTTDNQKPFECVGTAAESMWALDRFLHRSPEYSGLGVTDGSRLHELIDPQRISFTPFGERPHNFPIELSDDLVRILSRYALGPADTPTKFKLGIDQPNDARNALSATELAEVVGGEWSNRPAGDLSWMGIEIGTAGQRGDLCFARNKRQWGEHHPEDELTLDRAKQRRVAAVVIRATAKVPCGLPALRVSNTRQALDKLAQANVSRTRAHRVLIAGTEGKSSLKTMLADLASRQISVHCLVSADGTGLSIRRSLASIRPDDQLAVIEASVTRRHPGVERGSLVRPHYIVVSHLSGHPPRRFGDRAQLMHDIAEAVVGMEERGFCILPGDVVEFPVLKRQVQQFRPTPVVTFGRAPDSDGQLVAASWDAENGKWRVSARIMGRSFQYDLSVPNSYAPQQSVAALLTMECLGLDLNRAVSRLPDYSPPRSDGRCGKLRIEDVRSVDFLERCRPRSLDGYIAAIDDANRLAANRRVVFLLSDPPDYGRDPSLDVYEALGRSLKLEGELAIMTVGARIQMIRELIDEKLLLGPHFETSAAAFASLDELVGANDLLCVIGERRTFAALLAHGD